MHRLLFAGACVLVALFMRDAVADAAVTFSKVADTSTPVPGGSGTFTSFDTIPSISGSVVVFRANGSGGQAGVYATLGGLVKIADRSTAVPGGVGNFADFSNTAVLNGIPAFAGRDASTVFHTGVYTSNGGAVGVVVDRSEGIPGGTGNFTSIDNPEASDGNLAFRGTGSGNQQGIYLRPSGGVLTKVVDQTVAMPGAGGNFETLFMGDLTGTTVAFRGIGNTSQGLYLATLGGGLITIADTSTAIPGGAETFVGFDSPMSLSGTDLAFHGSGANHDGIFLFHDNSLIRVADTQTAIPGGSGTFTSFYKLPATAGGIVAFLGYGDGGQEGIYTYEAGALDRVLDLSTPLDGKTINELFFYSEGLDGHNLLYQANFTDGSSGLFIASVPEPTTFSFVVVMAFGLARRPPRARSVLRKTSCWRSVVRKVRQ